MRPMSPARAFFTTVAPLVLVGVVAMPTAVPAVEPQTAPSRDASPDPAQVDVTWLTDEQGREYRLEALPKAHGRPIAPGRIRTVWGIDVDVAREDDTSYFVKVYRVDTPVQVSPGAPGATRPDRVPSAPPPDEPLPPASERLSFEDDSSGLPTSGQWRDGLVLADLTGDGRPEIVSGPARKTLGRPVVFVRGQDGTADWQRWRDASFPARPYDYGDVAVATSEVDGTATTVMALGVHLRGVMALRATQPGQFTDASDGLPFVTRLDDSVFSSRAIALADCNGDRRPDLLAMSEGPRLMGGRQAIASPYGLATFAGRADGTWASPTFAGERDGVFGLSLTVGDVNGDGRIDVAFAPGTLGERALVFFGDGACGWRPETVGAVRPRAYVTAVAVGDVDADGRADLVVGYTAFAGDVVSHGVDLLRLAGTGEWRRTALARTQGQGRVAAVAVGDLDADGRLDAAAIGPEGQLMVFVGDGRGGFTREEAAPAAAGGCTGSALTIGDVDGDGRGDLVAAFSRERSPGAPDQCPSEGAVRVWLSRSAAR